MEWAKYIVRLPSKICQHISQTKGHYEELIILVIGLNGCLVNVGFPDLDLVIAGPQI